MKLTRLNAALIAASIAITPLPFNTSASISYAEDTGAIANLPDWIPSDFNSAVEFRNHYGATHIDNGLICIVYPARTGKETCGYELRAVKGTGDKLKQEMYTNGYSETCFDVFVYQPGTQGDVTLNLVDPYAIPVTTAPKGYPDDCELPVAASYSFTVDQNLNITETDIFSWLPDCNNEYINYVNSNTILSVKDNYVIFCLSNEAGSSYEWSLYDSGKECFELVTVSDCRHIPLFYPDEGTPSTVYAYKAVKDGYAKIEYDCGSADDDRKNKLILDADCAVMDDAQTILLSGDMRVTLVDYDTGEQIKFKSGNNTSIWTNASYNNNQTSINSDTYYPAISVSSGPFFTMETNPAILGKNISSSFDADSFSFGLEEKYLPEGYSFIDDEKRPGYYSGTVIPENSMTVTRYDNGSADVVFKLKFTPTGDVNDDGEFNAADVVLLQKWLLGSADAKLINWKAADFCNDNVLNVFDLCLMRESLIQTINIPVAVSINESGGVAGANILYKVYQEDEKFIMSYADYTDNRDAEPLIIPISKEDYREIMSQAYFNYLDSTKAPIRWSEVDFSITLSYADGSQKKSSSDYFPNVLNKLRDLLYEYRSSHRSYVEPDERFDYGITFKVLVDELNLYSGPDESYEVITSIRKNSQLKELGIKHNNDEWFFTEYNGNYGWAKTVRDNNTTLTGIYDNYDYKPVIYLYPEQETDVHVELELTESELYTTYPKYNDGWNVTAYPDGTLLNKTDGTHHKYLFWESSNCRTRYDFTKGFCVAGGDTESFLKEKLTYMGLTEDEMNEFIVYWLPLMEHNAYNLITFQGDVYNDSAKLNIIPTPDSMLRVFMVYVQLEDAIYIEPQQLPTFERKGFTVVEWGGSKIQKYQSHIKK